MPCDLLADVFFLLDLQGQLDENLLQLFVDVVDTKLLKSILFENLESVDIQNAEHQRIGFLAKRHVDALHDVVEDFVIDGLGEGITGVVALLRVEGHVDGLCPHVQFFPCEASLKVIRFDTKQLSAECKRVLVAATALLATDNLELEFTKVKNSSKQGENVVALFVRNADA